MTTNGQSGSKISKRQVVMKIAFSRIQRLGLLLLAVVAVLLTSLAVAGARARTDEVTVPQSVLFIGDSFTAGATIEQAQAYPARLAASEGWNLHVDAQGATGFIADGRGTGNGDTSRLIDRLAQDGKTYPHVDLVVIDGGRNDLNLPKSEVAAAMSRYLVAVRGQWPDAKIAVIVPSFVSPDGYDGYSTLVSGLAAASSAVGAVLIDPVAEDWYDDVDTRMMVSADGVHPNIRGSEYIGTQIRRSLRDEGFIVAG